MSDGLAALMIAPASSEAGGEESGVKDLIATALERMYEAMKDGEFAKAAEYFCGAVSLERDAY